MLGGAVFAFLAAVALGVMGPHDWNWVRVTLTVLGFAGAFVVITVPDHFLSEHLWRHVALKHLPRIFAWTLGVLLAVAIAKRLVDLNAVVQENVWGVLVGAAALGIIPESGPHLIFVTLFDSGTVPLSILITSSIVQDGHGMLPLLAETGRGFVRIKALKFGIGLAVGALLLAAGH